MSKIGTMINHEHDPHCCGCWVIRYDSDGLNAVCNECGETRDLIPLLADKQPTEVGTLEQRWRDSAVTVPCDGDDVLGYWSAARNNFGKPYVGYVHYSAKVWHAWHDPINVCAAPDCWLPVALPSPPAPKKDG